MRTLTGWKVVLVVMTMVIGGSAHAQDAGLTPPAPLSVPDEGGETAVNAAIDLSGAKVFADLFSSNTSMYASTAYEIIDGDPETQWDCQNHDLSDAPANIFIMLDEPVTVGKMEVIIPIHPEPEEYPLRIVNLDVYGGVGEDGWAKIGGVRGNDQQPRFFIDLAPARVDRIRLRIYPRSDEVTGWAMLSDVRFFPPAEGVELVALEPEEIELTDNEKIWLKRAFKYYESVMLRDALPEGEPVPTVEYATQIGYLGYVRTFFDTMIEHGTDRYGEVHSPQWAGILDLETLTHPEVELSTVHCISDNQRRGDRILYGGNLQHDVMLLMAADRLTEITGESRYREAARNYLQFFLDNCTDTPTGLWPWGEHSGWDFYEERRDGRDVHHLLSQPTEFWELAWELNPEAVVREADGIINHIKDLNTFVYNRHADMNEVLADPRPASLLDSALDFANSGARFLRVWSFAYSKTGDEKYLDWSDRLVDHIEWTRIDGDGPVPVLSNRSYRPLPDRPDWGNTMLVGMSMLKAAPMLGDTELAARYRRLGPDYLNVVAENAMPEDPEPVFTTGRGMGDYPMRGLHWLEAYRLTGDERFLEAARRIGEAFRTAEIPKEEPLRLQAIALPTAWFVGLYEADGDRKWLDAAERYARWGIEHYYYNGLFRGTSDLWYYDSQLGGATMVYALVRLHATLNDVEVEVPANIYAF